jgi:hypothetical protein
MVSMVRALIADRARGGARRSDERRIRRASAPTRVALANLTRGQMGCAVN